ncbi:unnamed protein product [Cylindrotheca closterium]|uniref:Peptidase M50 domain-containing protein n=1 Tax=Cylindrotheca closterium TaxID=2856 RepID=A0AAD2CPH1_9STRA|nr:unnamed protein product [Cylindrotheca closterium]
MTAWNSQAATLNSRLVARAVNRYDRQETISILRYQSSLLSKTRNSVLNPHSPLGVSSSLVHPQRFRGPSSPINLHVGSLSYFSNWGGGPPRPGGNRWMQGAGFLGAGAMLLGKTKYLIGVLKLTKLASLGSMIFTIGTYSMFFGLPYAAGMVGLITVHEVGHVLVMHQRGIPFSPMVFMPFMGAMVQMNQRPRNAWEDALVAFGGPVAGSLAAGGVAVSAHLTNSPLLFALADFGFMVNLFNLIPLGSMDGGRIAGALSPWAHVAGLGIGGTLAVSGMIHNPIFYLILLSGGWETYQRFYNKGAIPPGYYAITPVQRAAIGLGYIGLAGGLALAMDVNERFKKPPEVLMRERELEKHWDMR